MTKRKSLLVGGSTEKREGLVLQVHCEWIQGGLRRMGQGPVHPPDGLTDGLPPEREEKGTPRY